MNSSSILTLIGDVPKYVIETVAFSTIFIGAIIAMQFDNNSSSIIVFLSIYAIAGYKLLPTLQQIFKSVSSLSAHGSVAFELSQHLDTKVDIQYDRKLVSAEAINEVRLDNVNFKYPSATDITLKNISVSFSSRMINTIAGHSGSGKTTLIDILLGLIPPDTGRILINGKAADSDMITQMQQSCGYVPQHIFILDDTVIENVAFGVDKKHIDENRIIDVLKKANAWDFVQKLPKGIYTKLGQDGKLLSGGQRQKIGIARCLYRDIKMLILDEPTSALDIESEYDFMMLLRSLKEQLLIIIISHRPSAIKCSDLITLIKNGTIEAHGTLTELKENSLHFRSMLEKSSF
ncbi:MAG: ABC transporter ATP-binding protein [Fibrobacter sp.]|nr:ABC transporter ATP-binding protein [Fibrobacter sp.]